MKKTAFISKWGGVGAHIRIEKVEKLRVDEVGQSNLKLAKLYVSWKSWDVYKTIMFNLCTIFNLI